MKKLILLFLVSAGVLCAQTAAPFVQRAQLLTSGRVPYVTANGLVTDSASLLFNSGTGVLSATSFTGAGTGLTGTAASLTAGTVTTNANLTGAVTSAGNATSLGSFTSANLSGALSDKTGTGVAVFGTSPALTTSLTTGSTTFALLNTTATTVNFAGGASTALNIGNASGLTSMLGVVGFDGATPSSSTAAIFPAGTTSLSSFRIPHGAAPTSPVNGDFWTTTAGLFGRINGATVSYGAAGAGTVSVVGAGSLTSTALVTGGGTTTLQTPSATATMDSSGNISTPGTITVGAGGSVAGAAWSSQGTAPTPPANSIGYYSPASVPTAYGISWPSAPTTGYVYRTGTSSPQAETIKGTIPTTDIATGNLTIGTSGVFTAGTIELGAASDTTISRDSAGVIAVEGNIVSMVGARKTTVTSSATPTFDIRTCDVVNITALATAITSMTSSMTITGVQDFQQLEFRILDNGTARAITWGANFAAGPTALPTTTTVNKALTVWFEYDAVQAKFMCMSAGSYP